MQFLLPFLVLFGLELTSMLPPAQGTVWGPV